MSYLRPPAPLSSSETDFRYLNYGKVKPSPLQPKIQKSSSEPELVHPDLFRDKLFLPAHPHQGLPLSITPQPLRKATKHIRSKSNTSDIKASEIPQETMEIVNLEKKRQSPILSISRRDSPIIAEFPDIQGELTLQEEPSTKAHLFQKIGSFFRKVHKGKIPPRDLYNDSSDRVSIAGDSMVYSLHEPEFIRRTVKPQDDDLVLKKQDIIEWNSSYGLSSATFNKIHDLIEKMSRLGGLKPLKKGEELNIPEARLALCLLAQIKDPIQESALDHLIAILQADRGEFENARQLIDLALVMNDIMKREAIQGQTIIIQIKTAKAYSILIDKIHLHYEKKQLNALTTELKRTFKTTAKGLDDLNRNENIPLKFYIKSAIEGIKLLVDDENQLLSLVETIYNLGTFTAAIYNGDTGSALQSLEATFNTLNIELKSSWYRYTLVLKTLANIVKDRNDIAPMLMLITRKQCVLNWKFSYAAALILYDLALKGKTKEIRLNAFQGIDMLLENREIQHIEALIRFHQGAGLRTYYTFAPLKHLKMPKLVNPNLRIGFLCRDLLQDLSRRSEDEIIRLIANDLLMTQSASRINMLTSQSLEPLHGITSIENALSSLAIHELERTPSRMLCWLLLQKLTMEDPELQEKANVCLDGPMEGELDREHVEILYEGLLKVLAPSTRDDASTHTPLLQVLAPPARDDASTHISLVQVLAPPTSDDASTHNAPASIENPNKESQSTEV